MFREDHIKQDMSKFPPRFQAMIYQPGFVKPQEKQQIMEELKIFKPIWEMRFSKSNPPPEGQENRQLLRPVYWLGNWQFACLNYYHPPKGIHHRCVEAEPFSPTLGRIVMRVEDLIRNHFPEKDVPKGWELNTCLINYYGSKLIDGKWQDVARVGEHKDFEPGPVASISFGERAFFQFVTSAGRGEPSQVVMNQWLEDSSLQIFGGDRLKKHLFHRVQRVEDKGSRFDFKIDNFQVRRINFTFRYVPRDHFVSYQRLPESLREDIHPYVSELAQNSSFFRGLI
jgi:DNA oxidative demethylase